MADNGMDNLEMVAKAAYYEASAAAVLIPNAWSMVAIIYMAQSNPGQLWDAADDWYEVKQRLVAADKEVEAQLKSLSKNDWSGKDRDAFEKTLNDYQNQIRVSYAFAVGVHVILKTMALLISMFIMMMWAFATILAVYAAIILALMIMCAIPVLNAWAASTLATVRVQATMIAGKLYMVLKMASNGLDMAGKAAAGVLGAGMAVDVMAQMLTGNTKAYGDFVQAGVNSIDDIAKGHIALLEQRLTAQMMGGKGIGGGIGFGRWKVPTTNIPKDIRPYISPQVGIKGIADVYTGGPTFTSPLTKPTEYGDDYVERTDALP
ncbi:hypothetical protein ACFQ07_28520 [Actinomadura adrarensis]|uniref:Type IV secretion system protein n=1 Tax=Actinomadura adrarensis TaxID=1819600 RepID=A0ABW3CRN0_9ACTN